MPKRRAEIVPAFELSREQVVQIHLQVGRCGSSRKDSIPAVLLGTTYSIRDETGIQIRDSAEGTSMVTCSDR